MNRSKTGNVLKLNDGKPSVDDGNNIEQLQTKNATIKMQDSSEPCSQSRHGRKSDRPRRKRRAFSPDSVAIGESELKGKRRKRKSENPQKLVSSTASNRPFDLMPDGQPFCCHLCRSSYVSNTFSKLKKKNKRSRHVPFPRKRVDPRSGKEMYLCNACDSAFNKQRPPQKERIVPSEEERTKYRQEALEFAKNLAETLQIPDAETLYCPSTKQRLCGCLQVYLKLEEENVEELRDNVTQLVDILNEAKRLYSLKSYSIPDSIADGKKLKRCKNVGYGNGHKKSKEFEEYVLEKRQYLKGKLKLCEQATQRILHYSNNFLHKKLKTDPRLCRVQRQKGKAALGLLPSFDNMHKTKCCIDNCVMMCLSHRNLLEKWREQATSSQFAARKVLGEMLTPAGGVRLNCYKFISMVTGCSHSTISRVSDQIRRTGGDREPREHGLKKFYQETQKKDSQEGGSSQPQQPQQQVPSVSQSSRIVASSLQEVTSSKPAVVNTTIPTSVTDMQLELLQRQQLLQMQQQILEQQLQLQQQQQLLQQQLMQQTRWNMMSQQGDQSNENNAVVQQFLGQVNQVSSIPSTPSSVQRSQDILQVQIPANLQIQMQSAFNSLQPSAPVQQSANLVQPVVNPVQTGFNQIQPVSNQFHQLSNHIRQVSNQIQTVTNQIQPLSQPVANQTNSDLPTSNKPQNSNPSQCVLTSKQSKLQQIQAKQRPIQPKEVHSTVPKDIFQPVTQPGQMLVYLQNLDSDSGGVPIQLPGTVSSQRSESPPVIAPEPVQVSLISVPQMIVENMGITSVQNEEQNSQANSDQSNNEFRSTQNQGHGQVQGPAQSQGHIELQGQGHHKDSKLRDQVRTNKIRDQLLSSTVVEEKSLHTNTAESVGNSQNLVEQDLGQQGSSETVLENTDSLQSFKSSLKPNIAFKISKKGSTSKHFQQGKSVSSSKFQGGQGQKSKTSSTVQSPRDNDNPVVQSMLKAMTKYTKIQPRNSTSQQIARSTSTSAVSTSTPIKNLPSTGKAELTDSSAALNVNSLSGGDTRAAISSHTVPVTSHSSQPIATAVCESPELILPTGLTSIDSEGRLLLTVPIAQLAVNMQDNQSPIMFSPQGQSLKDVTSLPLLPQIVVSPSKDLEMNQNINHYQTLPPPPNYSSSVTHNPSGVLTLNDFSVGGSVGNGQILQIEQVTQNPVGISHNAPDHMTGSVATNGSAGRLPLTGNGNIVTNSGTMSGGSWTELSGDVLQTLVQQGFTVTIAPSAQIQSDSK